LAVYRLSASIIGRSGGRSATAAAAYRAGIEIVDERTGERHDYTRRSGVAHTEILAPDNTPDWMRDRAQLWNAVEQVEKRKDAQLAREILLSLPHELDDDQRRELVRGFVAEQFVAKGMIADIAIHAPDREGDNRNHHAHVMLSTRVLTGEGFSDKKAREWNSKQQLETWRAQWAEHQNQRFKTLGLEARVDHRSVEARNLDYTPEPKLGPHNAKLVRDGLSNEKIEAWKAARAAREAQFAARRIDREIERFERWAAARRAELARERAAEQQRLAQRQGRTTNELKKRLDAQFRPQREKASQDLDSVEARRAKAQERTFVGRARGLWYSVSGQRRKDERTAEAAQEAIARTEAQERERLAALKRKQEEEAEAVRRRFAHRAERQTEGIKDARHRRAADDWLSPPHEKSNDNERSRNQADEWEANFERSPSQEQGHARGRDAPGRER
jgi:ATP-dependent exoDNAse (exonuclease V) alpha subunit